MINLWLKNSISGQKLAFIRTNILPEEKKRWVGSHMGKCDAANPLYDENSGSEGKHGWVAFLSLPSQDIKKFMYFLI